MHSSHTELAVNLIYISSEGGGGVTWEVASKRSLGVGVRTSFSTCNVAKYYYSESSQLGDTTL